MLLHVLSLLLLLWLLLLLHLLWNPSWHNCQRTSNDNEYVQRKSNN